MGTPKMDFCLMENPNLKWIFFGGIPILGNLQYILIIAGVMPPFLCCFTRSRPKQRLSVGDLRGGCFGTGALGVLAGEGMTG